MNVADLMQRWTADLLKSTVRESSFNMTRGGGGMKILRGGSEDF